MDDGSTDGSLAIAKEVLGNSSCRYTIHESAENAGVSASRNVGMAECAGEYFTFVDSDDVLAPDAVETMLRILETEKADAVAVDHVVFSGSSWNLSSGGEKIDRIDLSKRIYVWGYSV